MQSVNSSSNRPRRWQPSWSVVLLSFAPFLLLHAGNLWIRLHYQFFPLIAAACAFLLYKRWPAAETIQAAEGRSSWFERLMWIASLALAVTAVVIYSPWLSAVAFLLALGTIVWKAPLVAPEARVARVWLALWLLIPPPLSVDYRIVRWLQRHSTELTSRFLDLLGYHHLLEGAIIQLPGRSLFVEEACSGAQSVFSMAAFTILLCLWRNRPWLQTGLLLVAAVFWALVCNIVRLLAITIAYVEFDVDLSTGWKHEVLGYGVFLLALAMLSPVDRWLDFFFAPIQSSGVEPTRWARAFNRFMAGNHSTNSSPTSLDTSSATNATGESSRDPIGTAGTSHGARHIVLRWASAGAFMLLGLAQLTLVANAAQHRALGLKSDERASALDTETVPERLGNWARADFVEQVRERGSEEGHYSRIWQYATPTGPAYLSFDYPFPTKHDLTACYVHKGWDIEMRRNIALNVPSAPSGKPWTAMEVQFHRPTGERGYLIFVLFDVTGEPLPPFDSLRASADEVVYRLKTSPLWQALRGRRALNSSVYQFQVFLPTPVALDDGAKADARRQFESLFRTLLTQWTSEDDLAGDRGKSGQ